MQDKDKKVNFTIVPADDDPSTAPRIYSNFCAIQNSPFDFTLTFCELLPLRESEVRQAEATHVVKAPVRVRLVVPPPMIPGLIGALQENYRMFQESFTPPKGSLH